MAPGREDDLNVNERAMGQVGRTWQETVWWCEMRREC
jgi:hypothetical protein